MSKTIISPSLLSADFNHLGTEIEKLNAIDDLWYHLDIMDGHFVPNLTFGIPVIKSLAKIAQHPLDAHLMVTNPQDYLDWLSDLAIHNFTFHWEAAVHHYRLIDAAKEKFSSVGISLNPSTPLNVIPPALLKRLDLLLIMGVNPGFSAQKYIPETLDKVQEAQRLKEELGATFTIQIDGGVGPANIRELTHAGAKNFVSGNYIFSQQDYRQAVDALR